MTTPTLKANLRSRLGWRSDKQDGRFKFTGKLVTPDTCGGKVVHNFVDHPGARGTIVVRGAVSGELFEICQCCVGPP